MAKLKTKGKAAPKRSNGSKPRRKSTSEPHRAKAAPRWGQCSVRIHNPLPREPAVMTPGL